jgi:hypothetical protein
MYLRYGTAINQTMLPEFGRRASAISAQIMPVCAAYRQWLASA